MPFSERIGWLLLGMAVGFIAGYIVRALRELKDDVHDVKEELHEVDEIVKHKLFGDDGFMNNRIVADVLMVVVLAIVVWAAFASSKASRDVSAVNDKQDVSIDCTEDYLARTVEALNDRTTYTQAQAQANVELQKAQAEFLALIFRRPPYPQEKQEAAGQKYLNALTEFVEVSMKNVTTLEANPYPRPGEFQACLNKEDR